jgi:sugar/nucleoside kinase (ribokinase family)
VLQVTGEDRRFHIDPGANWFLNPGFVAGALAEWRPDALTLRPGYSGIDLALDDVLAAAGDILVMLDIMQPHPSRPSEYLEGALRRADVLHCNEIEARFATGAATSEEAVRSLLDRGSALVLLTAGGRGATGYTTTHRISQPGFAVDVVDVTGCGDAFCAGVLHWMADEKRAVPPDDPDDIARLLLRAQAVGAAAATAVGCVEGVTAPLVRQLLASQGDALLAATETDPQAGP